MRKISLNWDVQLDKILGKVGDINKKKNTKTKPNKKNCRSKVVHPRNNTIAFGFHSLFSCFL